MIINPLWFYLIGIAGGVKDLFCFAGGFSLIAGLMTYFMSTTDSSMKDWIKPSKTIAIIGLIALLIGTFIPNEKACYSMAIASCVTKENINYASEVSTNIVDYITEKAVEIIKAGE